MSEQLRNELRWTAATLQEVVRNSRFFTEDVSIIIEGESRTVREILNGADAALSRGAPQQEASEETVTAFLDLARLYCTTTEPPSGEVKWTFATRDIEGFAVEVINQHRSRAAATAPANPVPTTDTPPDRHLHAIPGLGRMTQDDDGFVTLQFVDEAASEAFMRDYGPSIEVEDMPPIEPATAPALERGVQALMARLSSLLDEDQFKDCEDIVRRAGVAAPAGGVTEKQAFDEVYEKHCNRPISIRTIAWRCFQAGIALSTAARAAETEGEIEAYAMRMSWNDQSPDERAHYLKVAKAITSQGEGTS